MIIVILTLTPDYTPLHIKYFYVKKLKSYYNTSFLLKNRLYTDYYIFYWKHELTYVIEVKC